MPSLRSRRPSRSGPRTPPGKKQMLVIIDAKLITDLKVAMAEDGTAASHIVEDPVRERLAKRKVRKPSATPWLFGHFMGEIAIVSP
jgi:hypothetical protein